MLLLRHAAAAGGLKNAFLLAVMVVAAILTIENLRLGPCSLELEQYMDWDDEGKDEGANRNGSIGRGSNRRFLRPSL